MDYKLLGHVFVWVAGSILLWWVFALILVTFANQVDPADRNGNARVSIFFATVFTILIIGIILAHI